VWDDAAVDWSRYDLVVIRSTWDYTGKVDAFLAWADSVPRLLNPADVVRWNHDKRYLAALQAKGVPTVPTAFLAPGEPVDLTEDRRYVVKPTVSAGASDTMAGDAGAVMRHVRSLHRSGRTAMVQPYLEGIDERGETAIVYIADAFSHAAGKRPVLGHARFPDGTLEPEHVTPRDATTAELDLAEQVLDTIPFDRSSLLYARVDLIPGPDGDPVLLELELIEPSLFLDQSPGGRAAARFAASISAVLA